MGAPVSLIRGHELTTFAGPRGSGLTPAQALELARSSGTTFRTDTRRRIQWHRWLVLEEDFKGLVAAAIEEQFQDRTIKDRLNKLISISRNVALDVVRKVCVVYDAGVTRRVQGASGSQQEAFAELVAESAIDEDAIDWHRYAYGIGPCQAIPQITDGELDFDFLVPHTYTAVQATNPRKGLQAASWEFISPMDDDVTQVVLDTEAWHYYSVGKRPGRGVDAELVDRVTHNLGVFPGATLRFTRSYGTDWWCVSRLNRVYGGTLEVALTNTLLQIVRRSQNRKILSLVGKLDGLASGAVLSPENGVVHEGDGTDELGVDVHDFDVDPDKFIKHINWMEAGVIESFGIPAHAVTFDAQSGSEGERILFTQQGLTEIRKQQLPKIRRFERELWYRAVLLAKEHGHHLADKLPDPKDVRKNFRLHVPPLAKAFTDPLISQKWWQGQIKSGQATYEEWMMADNPGMSEPEARKRVLDNIESVAKVRGLMASRIFGVDLEDLGDKLTRTEQQPNATDGPAEMFGRQGGQASGVARREENSDGDGEQPAAE